MLTRLHLIARFLLLSASLLCTPALWAEPGGALPPIAAFFDNAAFSAAELSPDARFLAVRVSNQNSRDKLAVVDLGNKTLKVVGEFADRDVNQFKWVNNERLVFDSTDKLTAPGDRHHGPGLFAVNRDGSDSRQLVRLNGSRVGDARISRLLSADHHLVTQMGQQNSEFVYVTAPRWSETGDLENINLVRVNTLTGQSQTVLRPGPTRSWLLDSKGNPRLAITLDKNIATVFHLDASSGAWRAIASYDGYLPGKGAFSPLAFAPDGTLYVTTFLGDKRTLHTLDLATGKVSPQAVLALEDYDFSGSLVSTRDKLLGIRYVSDARATAWIDEGMKKIQADVDALLPATVNLIDVAARAETPWVMVRAYSDRDPGSYLLYNTKTGAIDPVGQSHPQIRPADMGTKELVHYKARDGLTIPAWLTLPKGGKARPLPLVVLVHGGPYVRGGEWSWSPSAQFLASRGYAVLEPEYRGSTGYGNRLHVAGFKQWGLKMQDDIADGARWAIAQGTADPKRICIAGASYGGYATLMGLVNDPDLYQCGIDWVGVTDISLLYTGAANYFYDVSEGYIKYGMPTLIGDLVKDAERFKATSPIAQAARIKRPLLLAYGASDTRVPLYHGKQFYAAVKQTNAQVEFIVYDDEAHGWTLPKNRIDFWSRVEQFLNKHIGQP